MENNISVNIMGDIIQEISFRISWEIFGYHMGKHRMQPAKPAIKIFPIYDIPNDIHLCMDVALHGICGFGLEICSLSP